MCGIVAYSGKKTNAVEIIFNGLKDLEYRGYDSWGIAVSKNHAITVQKRIGRIGNAQVNNVESSIGIGHTRWATHGGVTDINAHPHMDPSHRFAIVHNGIVENYADLKKNLKTSLISETDTEILVHLFAQYLEDCGDHQKSACQLFQSITGLNAVAILDSKLNILTIVRNGSPLIIGVSDDGFYCASDTTPLTAHTDSIIYLDDNEGAIVKNNSISFFNTESGVTITKQSQKIDWTSENISKGDYDSFLSKEINEQPDIIKKISHFNQKEIKFLAEKISGSGNVILCGCGTASFCGYAGMYYFAKAGILARNIGAYEITPFSQFINEETIFIAISQSGETADTVLAVKEAKKRGAHIVALVNANGSTLERLADTVLKVNAGPEIAVVSTKAFTAQLSILYLLSQTIAGNDEIAKKNFESFSSELKKWLSDDATHANIESVARTLVSKQHIYIIGKHLNYPAAMETSLKIKEISYIHSEHFAAGELKHGVIALIEKGTPCIVLASNDEVKDEVLSSSAELKARGGNIIGISPVSSDEFDTSITTLDSGELTIISNVIAGQLLAYYLTKLKGNDLDKPRNLAKSVTVK